MKSRIGYFDILKGIAIYMVVMGHVLTYGISGTEPSVVFRLIGSVHMPLFFFISGYFTIKEEDGVFAVPSLRRRFLQLIVPMIAISSLWILYYPHSGLHKHLVCTFPALWGNLWKNGYWFTPVLFVIISLYRLILSAATRVSRGNGNVVFIIIAVFAAALCCADFLMPEKINNALSFKFIASYFPVFLFGGWARCNSDRFNRFAVSDKGFTVSATVLVATLFVMTYPEFLPFERTEYVSLPVRILLHCSLSVVAVGLCLHIESESKESKPGRFHRFWTILGRKSLQIYLFHYFFLFPLTILKTPLIIAGLDFVPVALTAALAALPIIGCCLCVEYFVSRSRLLSLLAGIT